MRTLAVFALVALAVPGAALAKGKVSFEDTIPPGKSSAVTFAVQKEVTFRVLLRVPTQGRARLFLIGKYAPRGALIDTETSECEGAAGTFSCRASYEQLPKGVYTWRVGWVGRMPAHVELTVRW